MKNKLEVWSLRIGLASSIAIAITGWVNNRIKNALLEDQVKRNTEVLKEYDLKLINYKLDNILEILKEE